MSSDSDEETSAAASIVHSVMESLQQLPAASQSHYAPASGASSSQGGLFGLRQRRVHDMLGGGHSADVLLWRKKHLSAGFLLGSTVVWVLFEWIGYHFVSVVSFLLLAFVVILFAWSSLAAFLNRDPPPVPKFQLSDKQVYDTAKTIQYQVNKAFVILYDIVIGKDVKRFLKLVAVLGFLVMFGSWFSFLSLVYIAIVAAHTLPVLYEKHGNSIDQYADSAVRELNNQYRKFDATVLNRIPRKQPNHHRKTR